MLTEYRVDFYRLAPRRFAQLDQEQVHVQLHCLQQFTQPLFVFAGTCGKEICLKLHNDGFRYLSRPGVQIGRHTTSTSQQPGQYLCVTWCVVGSALIFFGLKRRLAEVALVRSRGNYAHSCVYCHAVVSRGNRLVQLFFQEGRSKP